MPSECPICGRIYCDHPASARGQTYAQMMGDPPGSIPHREGKGCCCDICSAWNPGCRSHLEKLQEKAADLLSEQAVLTIVYSDVGIFGTVKNGTFYIRTEEGSEIAALAAVDDLPTLHGQDIAYTQADGEWLLLWTNKRQKIRVQVSQIMYSERCGSPFA